MTSFEREKYVHVCEYIDGMWPELTKSSENCTTKIDEIDDQNDNIFLPYPYIVPGGRFDTMFYWDSYFTIIGLYHYSKYHILVQNIVNNCLHMVSIYGRVLNSNKKKWSTRSQLPFLTSMIEIAASIQTDPAWRSSAYALALKEYEGYWCSGNHVFENGLSRFYEDSGDNYMTRHTEASWDMSPRFNDDDTTDLAPVDLNANLYLYEIHFSKFYQEQKNSTKSQLFSERAKERKRKMIELMWCEDDGFFYDYNVCLDSKTPVKSLATFSPMWVDMVDELMAAKIVDNLHLFETPHGLLTCDQDYGHTNRQWNYPYGWAPLVWMTVEALKAYQYDELARRIGIKWLDLNTKVFQETNLMWEKYNVIDGGKALVEDRYPTQSGFGWTNGTFLALFHSLQS